MWRKKFCTVGGTYLICCSWHLSDFSEESSIFRKKPRKTVFGRPSLFLRGVERPTTKMNTNFLMRNKVLNILFSGIIFEKKTNIFEESGETPFLRGMAIFDGKRDLTTKMNM